MLSMNNPPAGSGGHRKDANWMDSRDIWTGQHGTQNSEWRRGGREKVPDSEEKPVLFVKTRETTK